MSDEDRSALLALPFTIRYLKPLDYVIREGEEPAICGILIKGYAVRQKLEADGARQNVAIQIPGDALDLQHLFLDYTDHNVQALSSATVALVPRAAMQQLAMQRPTISLAFAVYNLVEASIAREWILNVGRRNARKRLAHLLCEVAVRLERQHLLDDDAFELPMTQEQLADTLGLTPVHVNRTLRVLEDEGMIARKGRAMRLKNRARLEDLAGFQRNYLHLYQQKAAPVYRIG